MPISRLAQVQKHLLRSFTVVVVAFAALFIGTLVVLPRTGQARALSVLTGSMAPDIPRGSLVVIRPVNPSQVAIGDVITFRPKGSAQALVTHRVAGYAFGSDGQRVLRTKGDANSGEDLQYVAASSVVGRVAFHAPYLGYLSSWAHTKAGFVLFVILPFALMIAMQPSHGGSRRQPTVERQGVTTDA
jgi:signal peptidase I